MSIYEDEVLYTMLQELMETEKTPVHFQYTAEFLYRDEILPVTNVLSLDIDSNYMERITDVLHLAVQVSLSDKKALDRVDKTELQLILTRTPTNTLGTSDHIGTPIIETYNAHVTNSESVDIVTPANATRGVQTDDLKALLTLDVQLVEIGITEFRLVSVSGIYRGVTMRDLLLGLFSHPMTTTDTPYGVNVVEPDNTEAVFQLPIQDGMLLINLPDYLQENWGVYATGIGYYLHAMQWYIYTLYKHSGLEETERSLTILSVSPNELAGTDQSYISNNEGTFIFATGNVRHIDQSTAIQHNDGSGWRGTRVTNVMDRYRDHSKGISEIPADRNVMEYQMEPSASPVTNVKDHTLTNNPWGNSSGPSSGMGAVYTMEWSGSNYDLLWPGIGVKILYKDGNELTVLRGTLMAAHTIVETQRNSIVDDRYVSNTILTVFAKREYVTPGE